MRLEATERSFQAVLKAYSVFVIISMQNSFKEGDRWTKTFALGSTEDGCWFSKLEYILKGYKKVVWPCNYQHNGVQE